MILIDTDHFSVLVDRRDARNEALMTRLQQALDEIAIPIVSVEEQLRGWLAQINRVRDPFLLTLPYDHLMHLFAVLLDWKMMPWSTAAAQQFQQLKKARVRIGTIDLRIASVAIANDALLLSASLRDFEQVPGLHVEDWLHTS